MLIVCCGMPRSGSTLQFNIVWQVLDQAGTGEKIAWRRRDLWDRMRDDLAGMAASHRTYALKAHAVPESIRKIAAERGRVRYVYVHRDLRDVFVSMQMKFGMSDRKAAHRIREALALEAYLAGQPSGTVLCQDYADLLDGLPAAVAGIAGFLGAGITPAGIEAIISDVNIDSAYARSRTRKVPFEHLRRKLAFLTGRVAAFSDERLMLHPGHVSEHRGRQGIWREKLTARQIGMLDAEFGERIRRGFSV